MRILILGASSYVGTALAEVFSRDNILILAGRNVDKLAAAAAKCKISGAAQVTYTKQDLYLGTNALSQAIKGGRIDLIIDAASASSRYRDAEMESNDIPRYVSADFLSRAEIMNHILTSQDTTPAVIFISTVLTLVKSPGRIIYAALKALHETYLIKLKDERPKMNLLIVHVGTVIDTNRETNKPRKLASAVFEAFNAKKQKLFFGLSGVLLLALFYLQPVLFRGFTIAQRKLRKILA